MCFPLPLPACCRGHGKREVEVRGAAAVFGGIWVSRIAAVLCEAGSRERASANGEAVTVGGFDDEAGSGHGGEALVEGGGADAAGCPQFGERPGLLAVREGCGDALIDGGRLDVALGLAIGLDWLEGKSVVALGEFKGDAWHGGGGAMLDGQDDAIVAVAAEIEVGIAPGVELRRSAQGLTGADGARTLSGMVDDRDGDGVATLQFTQEGEQWRDIAADILIDAMQTHERIEDEQPRLQPGDGLIETCAVGLEIEAQAGRGDHLDVELGETDAGGGTDAFEAAADDVEGVFGGIEQDAAGARSPRSGAGRGCRRRRRRPDRGRGRICSIWARRR